MLLLKLLLVCCARKRSKKRDLTAQFSLEFGKALRQAINLCLLHHCLCRQNINPGIFKSKLKLAVLEGSTYSWTSYPVEAGYAGQISADAPKGVCGTALFGCWCMPENIYKIAT
jgi:hypothetical protein